MIVSLKSVVGAFMLFLAGAPFVACSGKANEVDPPKPPPGEVWLKQRQADEAHLVTGVVAPQPVDNTIRAGGRVSFDDLHVAHVFSPVTGRVRQITADLGQRVKKGQSLAIIDSPDVGIAVSDLQKAEADLAAAKHNFERQSELAAMHAVSQRDYESASDDFRKAQAELERSRQKTTLLHLGASTSPQSFMLISPIEGDVIDRAVNPGIEVQGEYSGGGAAVELFTVGELDPVWVLADVYEMDLSRIRVGNPVSVAVVAYPDRTFDGKIDWASSTLDPTTRTIRVRCTLPNPERLLRPGMYGTVTIQTEGRVALAIPRPAIMHIGAQTIAFVALGKLPDGTLRFQQRPISIDEDVPGEMVPVLTGLVQGDTIVTSGGLLLTGQ